MAGTLRILIFAYGLFGFGYSITATFIVAMVRASAATRSLEPWVWGVVGLTALPSVAFWARIGQRLGVLRAFAVACTAEAVGVALSVLWQQTTGMVLAAALLGGTFMGITALGLVGGRLFSRGEPRRTLAVMTAAFGIGQIIGPLFAGVVYDASGSFLWSSLTATAALLVGALAVFLVSCRTRTP
jgi:MFS family permease